MKNHFTIEVGDRRVTVHNAVLKAFEHWKDGYAYAAYLAIMGGEHRIDKETEVIAYNDDVLKGELFATYRIYLGESEFPYHIDRMGLAPFEGGDLSDECIVSIPASSAIVYATIYLEPEQDDVTLCPGENALVRSLLGMESMPQLSVYGSKAILPNRPIVCDKSDYTEVRSAQVSGGVTFLRGDMTDFIVGDPPMLRYNAAYDNRTTASVSRTIENGGAYLVGVADVSQVKRDDANVPFGCMAVAGKFYPTGKEYNEIFTDEKLISDPLGKHAALIRNGQILLIGDDGTLTPKTYTGEPMLCSDGTIVSKMGNFMYFPTGGSGGDETKRVTVASGDFVAFSSGGGYDVFVYGNGRLYIYRYDDDISLKTYFDVGEGCFMTRLNDFAVAVNDGNSFRVFSSSGEIEPYSTLALHAITDEVRDGCFYGEAYLGDLWTGESIACSGSYGRFCNTENGLYYMGVGGSVKVGDFVIDGAAIKGETAYFLSGGKLVSYAFELLGTFLSVNGEGDVVCDEISFSPSGTIITLLVTKKEGT